tara:strand:- start:199 stop:396 length:198 start_codon:yes stop_codon:yes gene_type:complete
MVDVFYLLSRGKTPDATTAANGDALPPPPPVDQPGLVALGQGFESKTIVAEAWMSRSARSARSAR